MKIEEQIDRMLKEHDCKYLEDLLEKEGMVPMIENRKLTWYHFPVIK